jgi:hypothetical protein
MQKPPTQTPAGVNRPESLANQDRVDCRNPEPRDPVAHPHFSPRPPFARRLLVDVAAESGNVPEKDGH